MNTSLILSLNGMYIGTSNLLNAFDTKKVDVDDRPDLYQHNMN